MQIISQKDNSTSNGQMQKLIKIKNSATHNILREFSLQCHIIRTFNLERNNFSCVFKLENKSKNKNQYIIVKI